MGETIPTGGQAGPADILKSQFPAVASGQTSPAANKAQKGLSGGIVLPPSPNSPQPSSPPTSTKEWSAADGAIALAKLSGRFVALATSPITVPFACLSTLMATAIGNAVNAIAKEKIFGKETEKGESSFELAKHELLKNTPEGDMKGIFYGIKVITTEGTLDDLKNAGKLITNPCRFIFGAIFTKNEQAPLKPEVAESDLTRLKGEIDKKAEEMRVALKSYNDAPPSERAALHDNYKAKFTDWHDAREKFKNLTQAQTPSLEHAKAHTAVQDEINKLPGMSVNTQELDDEINLFREAFGNQEPPQSQVATVKNTNDTNVRTTSAPPLPSQSQLPEGKIQKLSTELEFDAILFSTIMRNQQGELLRTLKKLESEAITKLNTLMKGIDSDRSQANIDKLKQATEETKKLGDIHTTVEGKIHGWDDIISSIETMKPEGHLRNDPEINKLLYKKQMNEEKLKQFEEEFAKKFADQKEAVSIDEGSEADRLSQNIASIQDELQDIEDDLRKKLYEHIDNAFLEVAKIQDQLKGKQLG